MRNNIVIVLLFANVLLASAQDKASEAGIISDNDLYTSSVYDRYYTNGLEFFYRYLNKNKNPEINKKITEFRLGQYIYNSKTRNADDILNNDRPFAGYLFAEAGRNIFYQSESVLKVNLQIGYIGPNSFAQETQKIIHDIFAYKTVRGWQYQIKNALAIQANVFYSKKILGKKFNQNVDFHLQSDMNFGTVLNGITIGALTRISLKKLLPVYNSNLHGAALNADHQFYNKESELYIYIVPNLNYQLYDATIQGSLFNDSSPVTFDLMPFRFNGEVGLKYRKNNWDLSYSILYRGKEAKNPFIENYFYGSIAIGYLLN